MNEDSNIRLSSNSRNLAIDDAKRLIRLQKKKKNNRIEDNAMDDYCDQLASHR
jgi:uncharacterized protein (UPF0335 family)